MIYDIIIIGAGPAGMTAALYALRAGKRILIMEESIYGGQVSNTSEVANYPAIEKINGVEFSINLYNQVNALGAEFCFEGVLRVEDDGEVKTVVTVEENEYSGKSVIIANGAKRRKLGVTGEDFLTGRGVSYCATCDGSFFKGLDVAVVGGGNTAIEDAIYLAAICKKVYLIHRRDTFRGGQILIDQLKNLKNVEILYNSIVSEISGGEKVNGLLVANINSGEKTALSVSGVFVAIGTIPDNQRFLPHVKLDETGYIIAGEDCATGTSGIYAAGDTRKKQLRQIVTAVSDGAVAATNAIQNM